MTLLYEILWIISKRYVGLSADLVEQYRTILALCSVRDSGPGFVSGILNRGKA